MFLFVHFALACLLCIFYGHCWAGETKGSLKIVHNPHWLNPTTLEQLPTTSQSQVQCQVGWGDGQVQDDVHKRCSWNMAKKTVWLRRGVLGVLNYVMYIQKYPFTGPFSIESCLKRSLAKGFSNSSNPLQD